MHLWKILFLMTAYILTGTLIGSCQSTSIMSDSEEEHLVYLEFDSLIDTEIFNRDPCIFKLIGADTDVPVLQVGHQVFAGQYRDIPGTALFFEEDPTSPVADPVFTITPDKNLQFVCKTRKALHVSRVFVKKKCEGGTSQDMVQEDEPVSKMHPATEGQEVADKVIVEERLQSEVLKETQLSKEKETEKDVSPTPGPSWASDTSQTCEEKEIIS